MQEEVEQRSLMLVINGGKFTGRILKSAISKSLALRKEKHHERQQGVRYCGKQSVKQLVGQNQGVSNFEISDPSIKEFERIARRYGVDYAVKRVKGPKPKYLVFFKARDADALNAALTEYATQRVKTKDRPSVLEALKKAQAIVAGMMPNREKKKEIGAR